MRPLSLPALALSACVLGALAAPAGVAFAGREEKPSSEKQKRHKEAESHLTNGNELMQQGQFEDAIAEFKASENIEPSVEATRAIADCHEALGQLELAAKAYQQYLDEAGNPADADQTKKHILALKGQIHAEAGRKALAEKRYDDALRELEESQKAKPDAKLWYEIANIYEEKGENDKAIEAYRAYLKNNPDAPDFGEVEGRISVLSGKRLAPPPAPAVPPPVPVRRVWYSSFGGMGLGAAGILALGGGALCLGLSSAARSSSDTALHERDFVTQQDASFNYAKIGIGLVAGGAVLLVASVVVFYFHTRLHEVAAPPTAPKKTFVPTTFLAPPSGAPLTLVQW